MLNEVCERFVMNEDSAEEKKDVITSVLGSAGLEDTLQFDSLSKKRWLDQRALLHPGFVAGAPEDVRSVLESLRANSYDHARPLTRLRN
jgi:hypothetical protein